MESLTLKDILDLGMQGVLLVFVAALWQRLNAVTDMFLKDRIAAQERARLEAEAQERP